MASAPRPYYQGGSPTREAPGPISFLSDYGLEDEFVGVVHLVLASLAPSVAVVDLNHNIPAHDVRSGAAALWRSAPWLVPGVVLGVVDPGVGTTRRPVAISVEGQGITFVGPDNGLLVPAALRLGPISSAVHLRTLLEPPGTTFDGRDVFAPAAAQIATGVDPAVLGAEIDPLTLIGGPIPDPVPDPDGRLRAEVLWVDHFGNAQLNVAWSAADHPEAIMCGDDRLPVRVVGAYADLDEGEVGLVVDSYGMLSVSMRSRPAAAGLGLVTGDPVWLLSGAEGDDSR